MKCDFRASFLAHTLALVISPRLELRHYQLNHLYLIAWPITNIRISQKMIVTTFYGQCNVFSPYYCAKLGIG